MSSTDFGTEFQTLIDSFDDENVKIPCCGLKFVRHEDPDPIAVFQQSPQWLEAFPRSLASCGYSYKAAKGGWTLRVTADNIGCPAGATSLGLVPADSHQSFEGGCYVKPMEKAATPADFAEGFVYAPHQSGHPEFALFGETDCGRYETNEAARRAVAGMPVIPPVMQAVYYYHPLLSGVDIVPDIVHLYCTPVEAMRIVQGYCYPTGERFTFSCIGIRGVSCDMTAWPYLKQEVNATFLCLGARAITGWEGEYVGFGMPYDKFQQVTAGVRRSRRGYPFKLFPAVSYSTNREPRP